MESRSFDGGVAPQSYAQNSSFQVCVDTHIYVCIDSKLLMTATQYNNACQMHILKDDVIFSLIN